MPKILIVDDDRTTVKLLQTLLEMDGFEVLIAPRGQAALELVQVLTGYFPGGLSSGGHGRSGGRGPPPG